MSALEALFAMTSATVETLGSAACSGGSRQRLRIEIRPLICRLEALVAESPMRLHDADLVALGNEASQLERVMNELSSNHELLETGQLYTVIRALREFQSNTNLATYSSAFEVLAKLRLANQLLA